MPFFLNRSSIGSADEQDCRRALVANFAVVEKYIDLLTVTAWVVRSKLIPAMQQREVVRRGEPIETLNDVLEA
jgi:hypothetical protein